MTPLEALRKELLQVLPHADLIQEPSGEISILTRLVLVKDELKHAEISATEVGMREQITEILVAPWVDTPEVADEDEDYVGLVFEDEQ